MFSFSNRSFDIKNWHVSWARHEQANSSALISSSSHNQEDVCSLLSDDRKWDQEERLGHRVSWKNGTKWVSLVDKVTPDWIMAIAYSRAMNSSPRPD